MAQYETVRRSTTTTAAQIDVGLRAHMNKVYGLMSMGMVVTAMAAWLIANLATTTDASSAAVQLQNGTLLTGLGATLYTSPLRWVLMFAPLAFIFFGWGALMRRGSVAMVQTGFLIFAAVIGVSMSSIFIVFTTVSIVQTFLITAIAFAALSLWGYTTKRDISGWGSFLFMGVIGLVLVMIVNIFLQSPAVMFAISAIGILIFAGLTAFYTQDIKNTYVAHATQMDQEWLDKAAADGALSLYISFLNMFQFLLMFLGQQE
ncbi:MAG: Bax inhibitor-1/YccA family protein [Pseudomonadota bacterium]